MGTVEQIIDSVTRMDRPDIRQAIDRFEGRFKLDFSETYLNAQTLDQLRHILLAAILAQYRSAS